MRPLEPQFVRLSLHNGQLRKSHAQPFTHACTHRHTHTPENTRNLTPVEANEDCDLSDTHTHTQAAAAAHTLQQDDQSVLQAGLRPYRSSLTVTVNKRRAATGSWLRTGNRWLDNSDTSIRLTEVTHSNRPYTEAYIYRWIYKVPV